jgi:hypothetical protein
VQETFQCKALARSKSAACNTNLTSRSASLAALTTGFNRAQADQFSAWPLKISIFAPIISTQWLGVLTAPSHHQVDGYLLFAGAFDFSKPIVLKQGAFHETSSFARPRDR